MRNRSERDGHRRVRAVVFAATVAGAGLLAHNLAEFGLSTLLSADTLAPTAFTALLLVAWIRSRRPGIADRVLASWALLNVAGAALTVLPLPFLPFAPEQSGQHYAVHAAYAGSQLPLLWLLVGTATDRHPSRGSPSPAGPSGRTDNRE